MFGRSLVNSFSWGMVFLLCPWVSAQEAEPQPIPVHLQLNAGTPLRLYITKRVSYREGESVQAKVAEPAWAFDRIVIPAGTVVRGRVVALDAVPAMERAMAIV